MNLARTSLALALALAACGDPIAPPKPSTPLVEEPRASPPTPEVRSAIRCEECHEPYVRGWQASTHATAAASPYYKALGGGDDPRCDRCHQPLRAAIERNDPIHDEGVTCDACHAIREVTLGEGPAQIDFDLASNRKYGPLCDAKDHYFHRVGCSELHAESRFCAACHTLSWPTAAGDPLPVITDYEEWVASDASASTCQACHMAGEPGEVARGWLTRDNVSRHDLFGNDGELRRVGVGLEASATREGDDLWLEVEVSNLGAAHAIPAGLAGRRLILVVRALASDGAEVAREERTYARVLVDASGEEVPFLKAVRVAEDTRLAAGERRRERIKLPPASTSAIVEVSRRNVAASVAAAHALSVAEEPPLATVDVAIAAANRRYSGSGRRPPRP